MARGRCWYLLIAIGPMACAAIAAESQPAAEPAPAVVAGDAVPSPAAEADSPVEAAVGSESASAAAVPAPALATRVAELRKAVVEDDTAAADARKVLDSALSQLLATARAVDEVRARLRVRDDSRDPSPAPRVAVDAAFEAWRTSLPATVAPAETWLRLGGADEELHTLYQRERAQFALATTEAAQPLGFEPLLAQPVALSELALTVPAGTAQGRAVLTLAQEVERQRSEAFAQASAARRRDLLAHLEHGGRTRADLVDAIALAERKREYLEADMVRQLGPRLAAMRAAVARHAAAATPELAGPIDEISAFADETLRDIERVTTASRAAPGYERALTDIGRRSASTRGRLAVAGASETIGLALLSELAATLPPRRVAGELAALRRDLADVRLRLIEARGRLSDLNDPLPDLDPGELLARASGGTGTDPQAIESLRYRMLLRAEAGSLALGGMLGRQETVLAELERLNRELRQTIGARLLWTPSHPPIGWAWARGVVQRAAGGRAGELIAASAGDAWRHLRVMLPGAPSALAAVVFLLVGWRWVWLRRERWMNAIATEGLQSLGQALCVLVLTVLLAVPWALVLGALFRLMRGFDPASGFFDWVVHGVFQTLGVVLALVSMASIARANGPGQRVLGWSDELRGRVGRTAVWLLVLLVPGHFSVAAAWYRGDLDGIEYGSRALFILAWLGVAVVFWGAWRPLRGGGGLQAGHPRRVRIILRVGLVVAALSSAACAALGLLVAATAVAREIEGTLTALAVLLVAHGLAVQGVTLGEIRAAQWRKVAAALARKEGAAAETTDGGGVDEVEASGADTRRLVDLVLLVAGAIWLFAVWSDLLPVLQRLDEVVLWHVAESGSDGEKTLVAVSLIDLLLALAAAAIAVAGVRRVPGTIDLFLRQRSAVDAGMRYAIATVTRYAIVLAGIVVSLGLLGMRWSNLQWMAAALTVGLGFGLQEIFANFVSGLILLFERPVRVGDVVTVGDVTGTVSKIGTRATTILDFDRREVLIPNKALITDRLVNWTLSSEVTRITVKVGVGYGTDPERVHQLLRQAAEETPTILRQPAPVTVFMGFGASNLDFELRACVGKFEDRLPASNALYGRIAALFDTAGISIDYDQLDVRVMPAAAAERAAPAPPGAAPPAAGPAIRPT